MQLCSVRTVLLREVKPRMKFKVKSVFVPIQYGWVASCLGVRGVVSLFNSYYVSQGAGTR